MVSIRNPVLQLKGFFKYYSSHFIFSVIKCSWIFLVQPGQKVFKAKQSNVYCYLEQGFYQDYKGVILV